VVCKFHPKQPTTFLYSYAQTSDIISKKDSDSQTHNDFDFIGDKKYKIGQVDIEKWPEECVRNFPFAALRTMTFGERPKRAAIEQVFFWQAARTGGRRTPVTFGRQPTQVFGRSCRSTQTVIALRRNF